MAQYRQYYGEGGVPLVVDGGLGAPASAWLSQRARLRVWLDDLPDTEWSAATRCDDWDVLRLVRHLVSGSGFLGYTLHKASMGTATSLLREFDTHTSVNAAVDMLGDLSPAEARAALAASDASVDATIARLDDDGWLALAEAPTGHLAAYLAISHFVFDSWVHEYDLMLPRGEQPEVVPSEVAVTARYVAGLAALAADDGSPFTLRLTSPELVVQVATVDGIVTVTTDPSQTSTPTVSGRAVDVIDLATGRPSQGASGDAPALASLSSLAAMLAP